MEEELKDIKYISVEDILPNRFQPRLAFDEKELNKLAGSISKYGIIQPIVLRAIGDKYEIIAGERRYKASVLAGLKKVPAIIKNTDDNTSAEIALLENLQRKNLTPIEEAQSFKKLMDRGFTQEEIAKKMGISQSTIANKLRLLSLPKKVQDALLYGQISERHARSLLSLDYKEVQLEILDRIVKEKMTVKQTEDEISAILNGTKEDEKTIVKDENTFDFDSVNNANESVINRRLKELIKDINDEMDNNSDNTPNIVEIGDFKNTINNDDNIVKEEATSYDNVEDINPFQEKNNDFEENNVKEEENNYINKVNQRKEVIISNKIRECVNSLSDIDPNMRFNIIDELDTYKIVIEIDKDTY